MTYNRPSLVSLALLLFAASPSGSSPCFAQKYDPLARESERAAQVTDLDVQDSQRDREIPIRIFVPDAKSPAPLILFSHGLGGSRNGCRYLGEHWSARGYVVVALQHHGSDESVWKDVPVRKRMAAMRAAASAANSVARLLDVAAVLDQLEEWLADPKHQLHGRIDMERVGMSGHSFGAQTTQMVSGQFAPLIRQKYTDARIKAALMFSPNIPARGAPEAAFGQVRIPWMLMTGTRDTSPINDTTVADRRGVYPVLPAGIDRYHLVLDGARHSAFTDERETLRTGRRNSNHHRAILACSTAFWDAQLKQDASARRWLHSEQVRSVLEPKDEWQMNLQNDN